MTREQEMEAEVARLREENARLKKAARDAGGLLGRCARRLAESKLWLNSPRLANATRMHLQAQLCDELEADVRAWAKEHALASDKAANRHPAPPASEPTREALLDALEALLDDDNGENPHPCGCNEDDDCLEPHVRCPRKVARAALRKAGRIP